MFFIFIVTVENNFLLLFFIFFISYFYSFLGDVIKCNKMSKIRSILTKICKFNLVIIFSYQLLINYKTMIKDVLEK
jgi:hypothetical protein